MDCHGGIVLVGSNVLFHIVKDRCDALLLLMTLHEGCDLRRPFMSAWAGHLAGVLSGSLIPSIGTGNNDFGVDVDKDQVRQ